MSVPLSPDEAAWVGRHLSQEEIDLIPMVADRPAPEWAGSVKPKTKKRMVTPASPGCQRALAVLDAAADPMSGHEIADAAAVSFLTWANNIRYTLLAHGLIHLSGWAHSPFGPFRPLYSIGPGSGKVPRKPKKKDQVQMSREWKERTGYYAAQKAKRRAARGKDVTSMAYLLGVQ